MRTLAPALALCLLLAFPLVEVGAHVWTRLHVPRHRDYQAAAAFVRQQLEPRDLIVAAPEWTDPVVRQVLGDRIDLAMAGRSDPANYERLWALSIRGTRPPEAPGSAAPALVRRFGEVTVQRWELGPSPVLYHFTPQVHTARVELGEHGQARPCHLSRHPNPAGGGLGTGVLPPRDRIDCEGGPASVWVGKVVLEDLWLRPRYCVFQPVAVPGPLRVTFDDVPLGDQLVFYGGLYYEDERMRRGAPIEARIFIDGGLAATFSHTDGEGWKKLVLPTQPHRGQVAVEVRANSPRKRRFCWDATTRHNEKERTP